MLNDVLQSGMKGVFYGRHSTDKQKMDMQRGSVELLMKKYHCEIVHEYLDPDVSAVKKTMEQRKALQQLLKDAELKKFQFAAVYSNDRLARDPIEHELIRRHMLASGIPIVVANTESLYDSGDLLAQLVRDGVTKV